MASYAFSGKLKSIFMCSNSTVIPWFLVVYVYVLLESFVLHDVAMFVLTSSLILKLNLLLQVLKINLGPPPYIGST